MAKLLDISLDMAGSLENLEPEFKKAVEDKFNELGQKLYDKVVENLSGKILRQKSTQLVASIYKELDVHGNTLTALVGVNPETPKAWALEYGGLKNYPIFASKAQVLRFYWEKVGAVVFFPYVDHPPSQEFRFLRSALADVQETATEEMGEAIGKALGL